MDKERLVETLWDLLTDDRDYCRPSGVLVEEYADRIMADIDAGIISKSEAP